ncbi:MAG: universal stress protein [bacterium]|nr:universal stress protein [bacterium]
MMLRPGEPVLVAVDFSVGSAAALQWAAELARLVGAPLHVLHVAHDPVDEPGSYLARGSEHPGPIEVVARQRLEAFLADQREIFELPTDGEGMIMDVVVGLPVNRILEVAERERVQLIVMGGKGRTALADLLLGSKANGVTQGSTRPVVVVKSEPDVSAEA